MSFDVLKYEFKTLLNEYLASTDAEKVPTRSLEQLIAFNNENASVELSLFDQSLFDASQEMGSLEDEDYLTAVATIKQAMPGPQNPHRHPKLATRTDVPTKVSPSPILCAPAQIP